MTAFIAFIVILGILVLVHEFGHFISAKYFGVKVEEFALGFPPTLWSKKAGETDYKINLIPFGGYVKLFGEDGSHPEQEVSFAHKIWWKKIIIIMAGIVMNLVLGSVLLAIAFMIGLPLIGSKANDSFPYAHITSQVYVYEVPDELASDGGLMSGDEIIAINDVSVSTIDELKEMVQKVGEQPITLTYTDQVEQKTIDIIPKFSSEMNEWVMGIDLTEGKTVQYPWYLAIPMGFVEMWRLLLAMLVALWTILKDLVVTHQAPSQIAGPVGIYKLAGTAAEMGLVYLLQLTAILSINLAIINALPIPALDGGRALFIMGERLTGRKMSVNLENTIHMIGFILVIGILILVTIGDVRNFF